MFFPHMDTGDEMQRYRTALAVLGLYTFSYVLGASLIRRRFSGEPGRRCLHLGDCPTTVGVHDDNRATRPLLSLRRLE